MSEVWKVVATQMGHYDQILREPGEVFELLNDEDGTMPVREDYTPKYDAFQREIPDAGEWKVYLDATGQPVHRDFAEDQGDVQFRKGPLKGEVMRVGWMLRVPDETPCGIYPVGTDFWLGQGPKSVHTVAKNTAHAAPIRGNKVRPRRERPPA